jgi:hypothetical protein
MIKSLVFSLGILFSGVLFGQTVSISNYTGSGPLNGCNPSPNFEFTVTKSSAFVTDDTVFFDFGFVPGVQLQNFVITAGGPGSVGFTDHTAFITGINSGTQVTVDFQLILNCNVIGSSSFLATHTLDYDLNHGVINTITSPSYTINPPSLLFTNGTNLNYNNALFNTLITRRYVFRNSSNIPFSGYFLFRDTTFYNQNITSFQLTSVAVSNNVSEISQLVNDTTAEILIQVNGLTQGDSIVITETGYLFGCQTSAIENSMTRFIASYGCGINDVCKEVTYTIPNQAVAHFDPNDHPIALLREDFHSENCLGATTHLRQVIVNTGAGAANGATLEFNVPIALPFTINSTSYLLDELVESSIIATVGGQTVTSIHVPQIGTTADRIEITAAIPPGDSVIIEYDVLFNCLNPGDYSNYFNHSAILHTYHHPLLGYLHHPCAASSYSYGLSGYKNHPQTLEQTFNSLIGQMNDGSTAWFEVENSSPLILGNKIVYNDPVLIPLGYSYLVPYDLDVAVLEVKLQLENGLLFPNLSNFYLSSQNGAVTNDLFPFNVYVNPGNGIGTGDEVVAEFHVPASWSTPYINNGHTYDLVSPEFIQFFNSFKVKFLLEADCGSAPSNGVVHIQEQFLVNPTPACGDCKLPLAEVGNFTNINCPGCVMPGWNLTAFSFERQNIGFEDVDNNHLPDSYPPQIANSANIALQSAMVGDTLLATIHAFVSDGQDVDGLGNPVGFTFASAGFLYDEGMVEFSMDVVSDVEFIGATGNITINGFVYNFIVPDGAEQVATNGNIGIPMNIAALQAYGVPAFNGYDASVTHFTLYPQFKIIHNLNNASGGNPYLGTRSMNCFLYMGGTEFDVEGLSNGAFADATNPVTTQLLVGLDGAGRSGAYKYWCTAYEGRFLGVGVKLQTNYLYANQSSYPYGTACTKSFGFQYWVSVGKDTYDPVGGPNQTSGNIFHHEIRPINTIDLITLHFPQEYEPYIITFFNYDISYDSPSNVHTWMHTPYYSGLTGATVGSDYVTLHPSQLIDPITTYPPNPTPYIYANEENQIHEIGFYLKPVDCSNLPDNVPYLNNTMDVSFSNYPLAHDTPDTSYTMPVLTTYLGNGINFRNPNPELILTEQASGITNTNTNYWDVSLTTDAILSSTNEGQLDQAYIHSAENVFVTFASPSGNFSNFILNNLTTYNGGVPTTGPPVSLPSWNAIDPVYGLNFVGYNYYANQLVSKQFRIEADFNCSGLAAGTVDSLYVIKGWNCYGYPTSLAEACFADTSVLYFTVPETGLQVNIFHEDPINVCTTTDVSVEFDPTTGITESLEVTLFDSPTQSYSYVPNSAYLTNNSVNTYYNPTTVGAGLNWNFNNLGSVFNDPIVFHYQLQTACGFEDDSVYMNIKAYNFCGLTITDIDDYWSPELITNFPVQDSIVVTTDSLVFNNCGDTALLNIQIANAGNVPTGAYNQIQVVLPAGFTYTGSNPDVVVSNDTLFISVPENLVPDNVYDYLIDITAPQNLNCDTLNATFNIQYVQAYICNTDTCFADTTQSNPGNIPIIIDLPVLSLNSVQTDSLCAGNNTLYININSTGNTNGNFSVIDLATNTVIGNSNINLNNGNTSVSIPLSAFADSLGFVYGGCACSDTLFYNFTCDSICIADAGFSVENYCIGDTIFTFANEAPGTHVWTYSFFNMTSNAVNAYFPAATVGTYTITHIYTNLCGDTDTSSQQVTVTYPQFTSILLQGSSPFCEGDSVAITVFNAGNYISFDWNTGDTTSIIWADSAGIYHVNVTDSNGCVSHCPSIALLTLDAPDALNDTLYVCNLDTLILDAGIADTYTWSTGDTTQTINITMPGIYTVQACNTNIAVCCVSDTFVVILDDFSFNIPDTIVCSELSTIITSPLVSSSYLWSTGSTNSTTAITQSGSYWLTLISSNGCLYTDSFNVSYFPNIDPGFSFADTVCTSDTISCFYPNVDDSSITHHWIININGFEFHSYVSSPCLQFPNSGVVTVTHIISNACYENDTTVLINVVEPIEDGCITIIGQNPFCEGDSVLLTTTGNYVSIEWMDSLGNVIGYGDTIVVYSGGVYSANAQDLNGCISTCICTSLQTLPLNAYDFPDTSLCSGQSVTYIIPDGIGQWSTGYTDDIETFSIPGDYSVLVTTGNGCTYEDQFTIQTASVEVGTIFWEKLPPCNYHFTVTPALPNYMYTWSYDYFGSDIVMGTGADIYHVHNIPPFGPTPVTLTITDTLTGCSFDTTFTVKFKNCAGFGVSPNPFNNLVTIDYYFPYAKKGELIIYNPNGRIVYRQDLDLGKTEETISLYYLASGLYIVKLIVDDEIEAFEKIIKQ